MYETEKEVAAKAEKMLESALRNKIHTLRIHLNMDDRFPSIADATAESNFTRNKGKKRFDGVTEFSRLSITMQKHGYIQHYGIERGTARKGGERKAESGKTYSFKSHVYKKGMEEQDYIADAVASSGVVNFVLSEIAGIRGKHILLQMRFLEKIY